MPSFTLQGNIPVPNGDSNSIDQNSLEDDEESFVVLERTTLDDVSLIDIPSLNSFQAVTNDPRPSPFHTFNDQSSQPTSISTVVYNQVPEEMVGSQYESTVSVSPEDIHKQLQEVLHENISLKENLSQTNLAMKQHMNTVRLLQERASEVQKSHQSKFEETKSLILKLGSENNDLKQTNSLMVAELIKAKEEYNELKQSSLTIGCEMSKILSENDSLKKSLTGLTETIQCLKETNDLNQLQPTTKEKELHELTEQLTHKLEGAERARRQQDINIDKLYALLTRATQDLTEAHQKLALAENAQQVDQTKQNDIPAITNLSGFNYGKKLDIFDEFLNKLNTFPQYQQLRNTFSQDISTIEEMLDDFHKLWEEFQLLKAGQAVKESHSLAYDEVQKKSFHEKLDEVTAKLLQTEENLEIKKRHLASVEEALRLQTSEGSGGDKTSELSELREQLKILSNDTAAKETSLQAKGQQINNLEHELKDAMERIAILEHQAKAYQDDFNEERRARVSAVSEKERLLEDLKHLQKRNQDLIDDLNRIPNTAGNMNILSGPPQNQARHAQSPSAPPPRPQEDVKQFYCPKCPVVFTDLRLLEHHIISCLELTD